MNFNKINFKIVGSIFTINKLLIFTEQMEINVTMLILYRFSNIT